jgi:hypothetical protein
MPHGRQAWRLRAQGGQLDALTSLPFRKTDLIDPRTDDFFVKLIELRMRETDDELDDKRRKTGYKVVALSGAYGTAAETNPIDIDPDDEKRKLRAVTVYADKAFNDWVDRPERAGRFNFFPTAALITAKARLLLAMAKHEVERRGGAVAYCDTDRLALVATERGGFVPSVGGPYILAGETRALRALSWDEVEDVRERFAALNRYDPSAIPGTILNAKMKTTGLAGTESRTARAASSSTVTRFPRSSTRSLPLTNTASRTYASTPHSSSGSFARRFRFRAAVILAPGSWRRSGHARSARPSANRWKRLPGKITPRWNSSRSPRGTCLVLTKHTRGPSTF